MGKLYIPKIAFEITPEQKEKIDKYLPFGLRTRVFGVLTQDLIDLIEKHGARVISLIIERSIGVEVMSKLELKDGHNKST